MSLQYSPKIITDSLVMCLDASQNKSYPTDLPVKNGLLVWLDAADDSTFSYSSGTEVSQWRDKSGNNFHANQATTANQPSRSSVINSRKGVNYTPASGDFIRIPNGVVFSKYFTAVVLIRPGTQSAEYAVILDQDHSTTGYQGWVIQRLAASSFWQTWVANSSADNWTNANQIAYVDNTSQIVTLRKTSSTLALYSNGTSSGDVSINDYNLPQAGLYGLNIGYWSAGGGRYYNGDICEILIYNRDLTTTELKQVHTYLGQKWGISNTDRSTVNLAGGFTSPWLLGVGDGATNNMPTYSPYNKTFVFDGTNDIISYPNALGTFASYTFSFWARRNVESKMAFSSYGDAAFYWFGDNSWAYTHGGVFGEKYYNKAVSIPLGSYGHYCVTYDGAAVRIYRNGIFEDSQATTGSAVFNVGLQLGRFGADPTGYAFSGDIANFLMYTRALSAAEVAQNYESQKARFANYIVTSGLVLNLDAGNPYSYAGAGTTWIDVSGASSVAEFVGGPAFSSADNGTIYFDGGTAYCAITPSNNFAWTPSSIGLNNMTIDLWLKSSDSTGYILSKPWNGNGEYNYYLYFNGFFINTGNQSNAFNFSTVTTGNWINLVILVSTTQWGAYINGVQNVALANHGITNNTPTYGNTQTQLTLMTLYPYGGGGNAGFSTQGNIGSFRIYNRVLSASEVLQNYNATKGRFGL